MTGPPCSVGHPRPAASSPPAVLQTTTDDNDRHQRAKQYWPIRQATNNAVYISDVTARQKHRSLQSSKFVVAECRSWSRLE